MELLYKYSSHNKDFETQVVLSRMNVLNNKYEKPKSNLPYHPIEIPYYISHLNE